MHSAAAVAAASGPKRFLTWAVIRTTASAAVIAALLMITTQTAPAQSPDQADLKSDVLEWVDELDAPSLAKRKSSLSLTKSR